MSSFSLVCFSLSRSAAAFSKSCALIARFFFDADVFDLALDFFHVRRPRHRVDARARTGFVHHVNRFVRQKAARDITLGKFHRRLERFVGQLRLVMRFVFRPQPFQNLNRLFDRRRFDFHGLETSLQRRVFLDVLAVFVQAWSRPRIATRHGSRPA